MQYKVMGIKKDRRYIKIFLPILIIIPFLGFFLYFLLFSTSPIYLIRSLLFDYKPKVVYETFKIYLDSSISDISKKRIAEGVDDIVFNDIKRFEFVQEKDADFVLSISNSKEGSLISKELIPVGHIYWIKDTVKSKELKEVLMEREEYEFAKGYIEKLWNVDVRLVESLSSELKKSEGSIALLFPSKISKEFKVLSIDSGDLLKEEDESLSLSYTLEGDERASFVLSIIKKNVGEISSDILQRDSLVKINMTGVTAIARGLASKIDASGNYAYPARDLGKFLSDADLTHTSNEVSFVEGCSVYSGMRFCAKPQYIETLKASGIDIVELTGNH
ncbi:MAG: CapA family protein, partial [Candidatus Dojkabacteria bacterium]|nr:CapA family protein [Candidatus Dojkabacteria bacterium]